MTFHFEYEAEKEFALDYQALMTRVIMQVLDYEKCPYEVEVNIVITDNEEIQRVNAEYRQIDRATDVLSFPMVEYETPGDFSNVEEDEMLFHPETGELMLGDIMISIDRVEEQAKEFGHSVERELGFLTAHSMLHLCGYDHMEEDERMVMEQKQREIMDQLGIYR